MLKTLLIVLISLSCTAFSCSNLHGLAISPLKPIIRVFADQKTVGQTTITNDKSVPVTVYVEPVSSKRSKLPVNDWLSIEQKVFHLEPGEQQTVKYSITLPEGSEGEHYAKINYREKAVNQASVSINLIISTPLFVLVRGTEAYRYEIKKFKQIDASNQKFSVFVHNLSNVHVRPHGKLHIRSLETEMLVQSINVGSTNNILYPNTSKTYQLDLNQPLNPGKYQAEFELAMYQNHPASKKDQFEFVIE